KIKLATLPIGELMVRHPHFTQPIFVRFPRPAPLRGRDGVERFPPAADLPFEDAVVRQLVQLDRRIRPNQVKDLITDRTAEDVRRALAGVRRARPEDALAYFRKALGTRIAPAAPRARMPGQAFTMRMYYTQSVAGPTEGGIGVTVKFDSTTLESPMMGPDAMKPALDRMRGLTSTIVYDDRMNVVRAEFRGVAGTPSPITDQMAKSVKNMAFPLPTEPVGVGDSWTSETELPISQIVSTSAPLKAKSKLTVKQLQIAGADTTVVLAV